MNLKPGKLLSIKYNIILVSITILVLILFILFCSFPIAEKHGTEVSNQLMKYGLFVIFFIDCIVVFFYNLWIKNMNYEIQSFIKIISGIIKDFPNLEILVDPLDIDESNYHTGIAFKVFSENLKELFSGGNYKVSNENCIGFSGFTEALLLESFITKSLIKKILIPKYTDTELKKNLQKKGFITFQAIKKLNKKQIKTEAIKQGCNCYFFDNGIHKVK